jgi:hypothetical protein
VQGLGVLGYGILEVGAFSQTTNLPYITVPQKLQLPMMLMEDFTDCHEIWDGVSVDS